MLWQLNPAFSRMDKELFGIIWLVLLCQCYMNNQKTLSHVLKTQSIKIPTIQFQWQCLSSQTSLMKCLTLQALIRGSTNQVCRATTLVSGLRNCEKLWYSQMSHIVYSKLLTTYSLLFHLQRATRGSKCNSQQTFQCTKLITRKLETVNVRYAASKIFNYCLQNSYIIFLTRDRSW